MVKRWKPCTIDGSDDDNATFRNLDTSLGSPPAEFFPIPGVGVVDVVGVGVDDDCSNSDSS